ncbi:MAG: hypothetical protein KDC71_21405, partial [Acidobacteria bacterium]|nr:hypothetical protein [Acidobacteriota bacterium]
MGFAWPTHRPLTDRPHVWAPAVLLLATVCLFAPSLGFGLMSDDYGVFGAAQTGTFDLFAAFPAGSGRYFRPMPMFSFFVGEWIGLPYWLQHAVQIGLHLLNGLLIYRLVLHLAPSLALWVAAFFCLHPANVTDVVWLSARSDLLATFFCLGLLNMLHSIKSDSKGTAIWMALGTLAALASKEAAIGTALILLCWSFWVQNHRSVKAHILPLCLTLGWGTALWLVFYGAGDTPSAGIQGLLKNVALTGFYGLSPVPGSLVRSHPTLFLMVGLALVLLLAFWLWKSQDFRFKPGTRALALMVLPVVGALPGWLFLSGTAPRLLYFPLALAMPGLAVFLANLNKFNGINVLGGLLLAVFCGASWLQVQQWDHAKKLEQNAVSGFLKWKMDYPEKELVLLTWPGTVGDAPIFHNDVRAILYHAETGRFGVDAKPVLGFMLSNDDQGSRVVCRRRSSHAFEIELDGKTGWIDLGPTAAVGTRLDLDWATLEILAQNEEHKITRGLATFKPPLDPDKAVFLL